MTNFVVKNWNGHAVTVNTARPNETTGRAVCGEKIERGINLEPGFPKAPCKACVEVFTR